MGDSSCKDDRALVDHGDRVETETREDVAAAWNEAKQGRRRGA